MIGVRSKVTWDRPGMSPGVGVVTEVKTVSDQQVYMVRDANTTYALSLNRLTEV